MREALSEGRRAFQARLRRGWVLEAIVVAIALAVAYALKHFYSSASAEDLTWILRPTVDLVGAVTGATFVSESGEGYLSRELNLLVAPSCAGVNFLIAAFLTGVLGLQRWAPSIRGKVAVLAGTMVAAYALTILANTLRLLLGIELTPLASQWPASATDAIHRVEGVVTYFAVLCVSFLTARALLQKNDPAFRRAA